MTNRFLCSFYVWEEATSTVKAGAPNVNRLSSLYSIMVCKLSSFHCFSSFSMACMHIKNLTRRMLLCKYLHIELNGAQLLVQRDKLVLCACYQEIIIKQVFVVTKARFSSWATAVWTARDNGEAVKCLSFPVDEKTKGATCRASFSHGERQHVAWRLNFHVDMVACCSWLY